MSCANNNQIRLFSVGAFLVIATFLAMLFVAATFAALLVLVAMTGSGRVDIAVFKILHILLGSEDGLYALEIFGTLVLEIAHLLVAVGFANGIIGEFLLAVCLTELIDFLLLLFGEVETFERIGGPCSRIYHRLSHCNREPEGMRSCQNCSVHSRQKKRRR